MTRGLDRLIRLHRWRLAENRQTVAELERLAARLRYELSEIDKQAAPAPDPIVPSLGDEAGSETQAAVLARRTTLASSLMEVEDRMRGALRAVANAVREIRKYDLMQTRRNRTSKERDGRQREAT